MPTKDIRWVAGLIEGEGTIYLDSTKGRMYPRLMVRSTDKDVLDTLATLVGHGKVTGPYEDTRVDYDRKLYYSWQANGERAMKLMKRVYPYMLTRRQRQITDALRNVDANYHPRQT